jgi:hypothetical protein
VTSTQWAILITEGNYFLMKVDTGDAERHLRLVIDKYHRTIFCV